MVGMDNLGDAIYEEIFPAARKLNLRITETQLHNLAMIVDEAVKRRYGGDRVYVPAPSRENRDARIFEAKLNGESAERISKRESVSKSTVFNVYQRWSG